MERSDARKRHTEEVSPDLDLAGLKALADAGNRDLTPHVPALVARVEQAERERDDWKKAAVDAGALQTEAIDRQVFAQAECLSALTELASLRAAITELADGILSAQSASKASAERLLSERPKEPQLASYWTGLADGYGNALRRLRVLAAHPTKEGNE